MEVRCVLILGVMTVAVTAIPSVSRAQPGCFTDSSGIRGCPVYPDPPAAPRREPRSEPDRDDRQSREQYERDKRARENAERRFGKAIDQSNAANKRGDYAEALRIAQEAQSIFNTTELRDWIAGMQRLIAGRKLSADGDAALARQDRVAALAIFKRLLTLEDYNTPENRLYVERLEAYVKGESMTDAEKGVANAEIWLNTARDAQRVGNLDGAISALQNAAISDPSNASTRTMLAQLRSERALQGAGVQQAFADARERLSDPAVAGDASVVDARDVVVIGRDLVAQIPELARSPAARSMERGFAAVIEHDWPAALGWWKDALLRDPANAAIVRAVDLAEFTLKYQRQLAVAKIPLLDLRIAIKNDDYQKAHEALQQLQRVAPDAVPDAGRALESLRQQRLKNLIVMMEGDVRMERETADDFLNSAMMALLTGNQAVANELFDLSTMFELLSGETAEERARRIMKNEDQQLGFIEK